MTTREKVLLTLFLAFIVSVFSTRAQNAAKITYFGTAAGSTLADCGTVPATPTLCGVAAGWFVSNGVTWVPLGVATAAGVSSFNGQTGAVVYTAPAPPVVSVNGKTGAVVLGLN